MSFLFASPTSFEWLKGTPRDVAVHGETARVEWEPGASSKSPHPPLQSCVRHHPINGARSRFKVSWFIRCVMAGSAATLQQWPQRRCSVLQRPRLQGSDPSAPATAEMPYSRWMEAKRWCARGKYPVGCHLRAGRGWPGQQPYHVRSCWPATL